MSIKQLLFDDFGYDLNIAGGSGQSADDPIHVLSETEQDAYQTQYMVLRGIGRGRKVIWRTLEINRTSKETSQLLQYKIETQDVSDSEIITQIENYYFLVNKTISTSDMGISWNKPIAHEDLEILIKFPRGLSWLHFGEMVDYESRTPELGYSLGYGAPGIKATIFVYPIINDVSDSPAYLMELKKARMEIIQVHGENAIKQEWEISEEENHAVYFYIPQTEPDNISALLVTELHGYFIKVRITLLNEKFMREVAKEFHYEILNIIYLAKWMKPADEE
jgi:hypothetical protein